MTWFTAHIIMAVKLKVKGQSKFPVWENIVLVEAATEAEAFAKAEACGRREEGDDDGSFRWAGQPATWVFAGVRKLTECVLAAAQPGDGDELSFNELELDSEEAVALLAGGSPTVATYADRYKPGPKRARSQPSKRADRKRA
jgi:hypothetical protein